jgi:hypothetical protein
MGSVPGFALVSADGIKVPVREPDGNGLHVTAVSSGIVTNAQNRC